MERDLQTEFTKGIDKRNRLLLMKLRKQNFLMDSTDGYSGRTNPGADHRKTSGLQRWESAWIIDLGVMAMTDCGRPQYGPFAFLTSRPPESADRFRTLAQDECWWASAASVRTLHPDQRQHSDGWNWRSPVPEIDWINSALKQMVMRRYLLRWERDYWSIGFFLWWGHSVLG